MDFNELTDRAYDIRKKYETFERSTIGRTWTRAEIVQGFVTDVGDLVRLTMVKDGARHTEDVDAKLRHELADCFWSLIVIAKKFDVDLESAFTDTMDVIEKRVAITK